MDTQAQKQTELTVCPRCGTPTTDREMVDYLDRGEMCRRCLGVIRGMESRGEIKKALLPEHYAEEVRNKMKELCTNSNCKACYGRGYVGMNDNNVVVTCRKCVPQASAYAWFRDFVKAHEDLHEMFPWAMVEEKSEEIRVKGVTVDSGDADAVAIQSRRDAETQRPGEVHEGEE